MQSIFKNSLSIVLKKRHGRNCSSRCSQSAYGLDMCWLGFSLASEAHADLVKEMERRRGEIKADGSRILWYDNLRLNHFS